MEPNERASNQGFTLLELTLAMALSGALLIAFFTTSQALMRGLAMAADGARGPAQAAESMDQICLDLEQATSFSVRSAYNIEFLTPSGTIGYRLFARDAASQDVVLERAVNGASQSIGPAHMIANFNPDRSTFIIDNNPTTATVSLFFYNTPSSNEGPKAYVYLVLRPNQTAPVSYLRTMAFCYARTTW